MRARKLGWCGYATMYRMLLDEPTTAMDMAERMGVSKQTVCRVLDRFCDVGFAHRCAWVSPRYRSKEVALYAAGEGQDAPHPAHHKGRARLRHNALPEVVAMTRILVLLRAPIARSDLVEQSGCSAVNLRRLLNHCRDIGLVRIAAWDKTNPGKPAAMFCIGEGQDAPRPQPKSRSQINREQRLGRLAKERQLTLIRAIASPIGHQLEAA